MVKHDGSYVNIKRCGRIGWLIVDCCSGCSIITIQTNNKTITISMPPKKKTPDKEKRPPASLNGANWGTSDARNLIGQDIIDGNVPPMGVPFDPKDFFDRLYAGHSFFKDFPFDHVHYKGPIESLQTILDSKGMWAQYDEDALAQDLAKRPPKTHNIRGELRWDGSKAQKTLAKDLEEGFTDGMKPRELWCHPDRPEYREFGLTVFRKHFDQRKQLNKPFDATPGQAKKNKSKIGGKEYKRQAEE